jgi:hypothetical protein
MIRRRLHHTLATSAGIAACASVPYTPLLTGDQ